MRRWQCGTENSPAMTFCGQFGAALATASAAQAASPDDGRAAPTLEGTIEGERKLVTILFADVSGLTTLSEPLNFGGAARPDHRLLRPPGALHPALRRRRGQVHGLG